MEVRSLRRVRDTNVCRMPSALRCTFITADLSLPAAASANCTMPCRESSGGRAAMLPRTYFHPSSMLG